MIGSVAQQVAVGADIPVQESTAAFHDGIRAAVDGSFSRTNLNFHPDSDFELIVAAGEAFPETAHPQRLQRGLHARRCRSVPPTGPPRPCDARTAPRRTDLFDDAKFQREFDTPICLDETITAPAIAKRAVATNATRWVNIEFRRGGGLTNAIAIQRYCIDLPCWVGGTLESFVGRSASPAFATLPRTAYVADISPAGRLYEKTS